MIYKFWICFEALKTPAKVRAYFRDIFPNPKENNPHTLLLVGDNQENPEDIILEKISSGHLAADTDLAVAGIVLSNVEWFYRLEDETLTEKAAKILSLWESLTIAWLKKSKCQIIKAVRHVDKNHQTKIHFVVWGKALLESYFPESPLTSISLRSLALVFEKLNNDYIDYLNKFGLFSFAGIEKPNHWKIVNYYNQSFEWKKSTNLETMEGLFPPQPPKIQIKVPAISFSPDNPQNLFKYIRSTASLIFKEQYGALYQKLYVGTLERRRLKIHQAKYQDVLKKRQLSTEVFSSEAALIRGPDLEDVLKFLYGAICLPGSSATLRIYELPNGEKIQVTGDSFFSQRTLEKGLGAIRLVMYLSGYKKAEEAIHELHSCFSKELISGAWAYYQSLFAKDNFERILLEPFKFPVVSESTWGEARGFLEKNAELKVGTLDKFHRKKLILSDKWGAILFVCDKKTGVFFLSSELRLNTFNMEDPGVNALPFWLPGSNKRVIITKNPLEAFKVREQDPSSAILALGKRTRFMTILPYLKGKMVELWIADPSLEDYLRREGVVFQKKRKSFLPKRVFQK
ncbi:MAG: hypothetical protein LBF22_04645 [Deltaproteobacteria bacterium]|jgi:hypothetical protein|nr:hypothetical protein [Deltaproteobacteria bacterium]